MPRPRGVNKEAVVRLPLSEGDWIDVRTCLTAGELRDIFGVVPMRQDGVVELDTGRKLFRQAAAYITAWSFHGVNGLPLFWPGAQSLDRRVEALRDLDQETLAEVEHAVDVHHVASVSQKKTLPSDESATSTSESAK